MLRTIVILGVLAVCAFMAGWFTIDRSAEETTIRFNRDEIRSDTSNAIAKGRELLNKNSVQQTAGDAQELATEYGASEFGNYDQAPSTQEFYTPQQANRDGAPWQQPMYNQPTQY